MAAHQMHINFDNYSTSKGRDAEKVVDAAKAHMRYIFRPKAFGEKEPLWASSGLSEKDATGNHRLTLSEQKAELRRRFEAVSKKRKSVGVRVAEKSRYSIPNEWDDKVTLAAMEAVCKVYAPEGSEASAIAVLHRDTENNRHFHIIGQDGRESVAAAEKRRGITDEDKDKGKKPVALGEAGGKKKGRLRRRNVARLGDKSRAKEMRLEIMDALNAVADKHKVRRVEARSYEDQGKDQEKQVREGHNVRAVAEKRKEIEAEKSGWDDLTKEQQLEKIDATGRMAFNHRVRGRVSKIKDRIKLVSRDRINEMMAKIDPKTVLRRIFDEDLEDRNDLDALAPQVEPQKPVEQDLIAKAAEEAARQPQAPQAPSETPSEFDQIIGGSDEEEEERIPVNRRGVPACKPDEWALLSDKAKDHFLAIPTEDFGPRYIAQLHKHIETLEKEAKIEKARAAALRANPQKTKQKSKNQDLER